MKGGQSDETIINETLKKINNAWVIYFIKHDPALALEKVQCPVLAVNGSKDMQVPSEVNLAAIKNALDRGKNSNFKIKEFEGLNHLFQECNTGSVMEYATIKQTFSPVVLEEILNWITTIVKD